MKSKKIVVVGANAGGMTAASKLRREQPEWEIIAFERGSYTSYAACGIPYYIAGDVKSKENLIARKPEVFIEKQNIDVRIRHEVLEIDIRNKQVKVKNLDKNEEFIESWDELLIATGSSAIFPDVQGIDAKGIFELTSLKKGADAKDFIKMNNPQKAVIIGGGYIGLEMAETLLDRGMDVSLIDMASQLMNSMDQDITDSIAEYMKAEGVKLFLNEKLDHFETNKEDIIKTVVTDKQTHKADIVIVGIGVKPNTGLAVRAGIKLGENDAIHVNKKMQTSVPGVWAAGDCAESFHLVKAKQVHVPLGTVANKQSLVAGINIAGGNIEFPGVLGTAITKFRELEIARTGLSEKEAKNLDFKFIAKTIDSTTLSSYYPYTGKIKVKLVAEKNSGRILGAQIVGRQGAGKRIDTIAAAITAKMNLQNIVDMDLSYAPPFSPVWDPVQIAARAML